MITISIPGSKSYTNRALVMAALTEERVIIRNYLKCDDTDAMIHCLECIGISVMHDRESLVVDRSLSNIDHTSARTRTLHCRMSGTTIRFLSALCALVPGTFVVTGDKRLTERPIGDLVDALVQMGASISYMNEKGFPPLTIQGGMIEIDRKHTISVSGKISSQFLSALLMIGPYMHKDFTIIVQNDLISKSYVDMTIHMMQKWGVNVRSPEDHMMIIPGGSRYSLSNGEYVVEGDYSAAGYFFAISALTKKKLRLTNLNADSVQGDKQFMQLLQTYMRLEIEARGGDAVAVGHGVRPVEVNMENCPDQAQTLAVLCAFAKGRSVLRGVRSLRVKETERVRAIQNELAKMDIYTESPDIDTLIIHGGNPKSAVIETYNDHRMAMSFAVAKSVIPELQIKNPEVVHKTFPSFWTEFAKL